MDKNLPPKASSPPGVLACRAAGCVGGTDHPWGCPCSASRRGRRRRGTLCPGGGLSYRWADSRAADPLHGPCGQRLSAALALLPARGLRVFTM
jgi:hypothetical protein